MVALDADLSLNVAGGGEGHSKADSSSLGSESVMEEGGPIPVRKLHHLIVGQASFSGTEGGSLGPPS